MPAIPIIAAVVTAGAAVYSASQSNRAINNATQATTQSNDAALALNRAQADRADAEIAPWRTVGAGALQMLARTEGIQVPADTFSYYHLPAANDTTAPAPGSPASTPAPGTTGGTPAPTAAAPPPLVTPGKSAGQAYLDANPDVAAEYNRILPTVDWNSPWAAQHGFVQGDPGAFGVWHYQNFGQNEGRTAPTAVDPVYGPAPTSTPTSGSTPAPTLAPTGATDINGQPIVSTTGKPTGLAPASKAPSGSDPRYGDFFASPDYQFRLDEGSRAITGNAAAKGLLDSGSLGKGLIKFGSNTASSEFGSWYNRIAALAGVGQTAVTNSSTLGQAAANAQTGIIQNQGQSLASSIAAQGGVNAGLISNLGNTAAGVIRNFPTSPTAANSNVDAAAINAGAVDFGSASRGLFGPPI